VIRVLCSIWIVCLCAITTARADVVRLANGDELTVTIVERDEANVTFEHPTLGRLTLPAAAVTLNPTPAEGASAAGATPPAPAVPAPEPAPLRLLGVSIMDGWKRRLELSADGSRGNSDTASVRVGFDGRYENTDRRWIVEADYYHATSNNGTSDNKFAIDVTRDWLTAGSPWFYFLKGRYDYDDFDTFRHRATVSGGVGYQFVKRDDFDLLLRVGAGGNYAWDAAADGVGDEFTPEGLVGVEGAWRIDLRFPLEFRNTFYPDLDDAGEFRNLSKLSLLVPIDVARSMYFKIGLENEYESQTLDDSRHNDLRYAASLVVEF